MALTGWNKVIEKNGNVYYHKKQTGVVRFSAPPVTPVNFPLKKATTMASFTKVRDAEGRLQRGYHIGDNYYVTVTRFEGVKYITFGKYENLLAIKEPLHASTPSIALDEELWEELCKNKNIVTELASQHSVSAADGTDRACNSPPEKFGLAVGKGNYIRILVDNGEVKVDIRRFEFSSERTFDSEGKQVFDPALDPRIIISHQHQCDFRELGITPGRVGTTLHFEQWKNMTSLEGLIAVEHLKTLINKKVPTDAVVSEEEEEFSLLNLRNNLNEHPRRPSSIIQFSLLQIS